MGQGFSQLLVRGFKNEVEHLRQVFSLHEIHPVLYLVSQF